MAEWANISCPRRRAQRAKVASKAGSAAGRIRKHGGRAVLPCTLVTAQEHKNTAHGHTRCYKKQSAKPTPLPSFGLVGPEAHLPDRTRNCWRRLQSTGRPDTSLVSRCWTQPGTHTPRRTAHCTAHWFGQGCPIVQRNTGQNTHLTAGPMSCQSDLRGADNQTRPQGPTCTGVS
jgi:hypothetical protein